MKKILFIVMIFFVSCKSENETFSKKVFSDKEAGITLSFNEPFSDRMRLSLKLRNIENKNLFLIADYRPVSCLNVNLENALFVDKFTGEIKLDYPRQSCVSIYELHRFAKPSHLVSFRIIPLYGRNGDFKVHFYPSKEDGREEDIHEAKK